MDFIRLASESRKPHGTTGHYGGILSPHLIKVDESTRRMDKLAFARLCIEVFRDLKLPSSISIVLQESRNIDQLVEYKRRSLPCSFCGLFGHAAILFPQRKKKEVSNDDWQQVEEGMEA